MIRRSFFRALLAAAGATALALLLLIPSPGKAGETVDYKPGVIKEALATGKAVLVDYAADWCSTCAAQHRVIGALREENPAYDKKIIFVRVDWDDYRRHEVTKSRRIPRRSTLVLLKGDAELGRLIASTRKDTIRSLLEKGL
ncbi:MAG: thioredoxin family protein [Neomegalonema sp.]|nr:thioredoxin family protein [Neomegalonema sp.]